MIIGGEILQLKSMYPCQSWMLDNQTLVLPEYAKHCSLYGYSYGTSELTIDGKKYTIQNNQFFSFTIDNSCTASAAEKLFLVLRLGYRVPNQMGWAEEHGRLTYIDGCSDSILIYPARLGDSSLNLLYFPPGILQSFHRHPSIRLGCVIGGSGLADYGENVDTRTSKLEPGSSFCLDEQERHRFRTDTNSMTIVAFHPDGDWGPTDHNHLMLNRTYIVKNQ